MSVFRNAAFLLLARAVSLISRLAFVLIAARELGAQNYGTFVYVQAWCLLFLPLIHFGSQSVMSRYFGQGPRVGIDIAAKLLGFRAFLLPVVAGMCLLSGWLVESNPDTRFFLLVACIGLMGRGLALWASHFFIASENSQKVLLLDFFFRPLEVVAASIFLINGGGIKSLLFVYATVWWLQAGVSYVWIKRSYPGLRPSWKIGENVWLLRDSGASLIVSLAVAWFMQAPLAIGRWNLDAVTFGQFALAMQLLQVCAMVPGAFGNAAMPALSRSFHNNGAADQQYVLLAIPVSLFSAVILTVLVYLMGDSIIPLVFGSSYGTAAEFLAFGLIIFVAPYSTALLLSNAALARGLFKWSSRIAMFPICLAVALAFYFTPNWSVYGLLLAFGCGSVVWTAVLFARLKRQPEGNPN